MLLRVDLSAMIVVLMLPNLLIKYFMNFDSFLLFFDNGIFSSWDEFFLDYDIYSQRSVIL